MLGPLFDLWMCFNPNRSLEKTPSICKHTPLFLFVVDYRNFLIARKYSVFKQKR